MPGGEFEELKSLVALLPQGFGDDMLRFNGLGERITAAMNNNNRPTDADKAKYYEIVKWAARPRHVADDALGQRRVGRISCSTSSSA